MTLKTFYWFADWRNSEPEVAGATAGQDDPRGNRRGRGVRAGDSLDRFISEQKLNVVTKTSELNVGEICFQIENSDSGNGTLVSRFRNARPTGIGWKTTDLIKMRKYFDNCCKKLGLKGMPFLFTNQVWQNAFYNNNNILTTWKTPTYITKVWNIINLNSSL